MEIFSRIIAQLMDEPGCLGIIVVCCFAVLGILFTALLEETGGLILILSLAILLYVILIKRKREDNGVKR